MGATHETDVIVLGVGTCGEDLALRLLGAGLEVVGIEANLVGGECPYWACLPSKTMIRSANLLQEARRLDGYAGSAPVTADWASVAERVRTEVTGGWDDSYATARFTDRGGVLVHGYGTLTGRNTVAVGDDTYEARRGIVVATGSRPAIPPIPGLDDMTYWTTHDVIRADQLPASLVVLGGGAIGCELGQVLARFDVDVTIVEGMDRLLPLEEPEASAAVEDSLTAEGISVRTGATAVGVEQADGSIVVHLDDATAVEAEKLLVATGREVDLSGLGLEAAGIDGMGPFLEVDDQMRAADSIWAMGDVTGKAMFTHVAEYQSAIVAQHLLGLEATPARYDAVPRTTFTDPEVGSVGLTEARARHAGIDVVVAVKHLGATFRGWLHGPGNSGLVKLVVDGATGTLVGATAVGPHGGEVLGMLTLAVHAGLSLSTLRSMIYAFPTFHGAIGEAVGAYGRGLATVMDPGYSFEALDRAG